MCECYFSAHQTTSSYQDLSTSLCLQCLPNVELQCVSYIIVYSYNGIDIYNTWVCCFNKSICHVAYECKHHVSLKPKPKEGTNRFGLMLLSATLCSDVVFGSVYNRIFSHLFNLLSHYGLKASLFRGHFKQLQNVEVGEAIRNGSVKKMPQLTKRCLLQT